MSFKKTPEEEREYLRQKELKNNSLGSLNEGVKRGKNSSLVDLIGSLNWKTFVILILLLFFMYVISTYFF